MFEIVHIKPGMSLISCYLILAGCCLRFHRWSRRRSDVHDKVQNMIMKLREIRSTLFALQQLWSKNQVKSWKTVINVK